jgi:trigger factor
MKKKYMAVAVMAAMVTMLSACGQSAGTQGDGASAETTATESGTAENAAAQQEGAGEAGTSESSDASTESSSTPAIDISGLETTTLKDVDVDKLVVLGDYKGLKLNVVKTEVTDEMVENSLKSSFASNPLMKEVTDRAIQNGDTANIDYEGKYADTKEAFDGGTAQGYDLKIGSGTFIPGFEDGLVGVEAGKTVDLNLTFPEDYGNADLAGKDVIFTVKVNSIKTADAEPSDEWAKGLGIDGVESLDDLRAHLREDQEKDAQEEYDSALRNAAVEAATENATVDEIPEKLYNRYFVQIYESAQNYVQQIYYTYGMQVSVEEYVGMVMQDSGLTGTAEDYLSDLANQQAKRCLVMEAIAHKEGIEISGETVDEYIQKDFDDYFYQGYSTIEEYKETFDPEDYREQIMVEKVSDFLVENAAS